jgi:hypothetical protein
MRKPLIAVLGIVSVAAGAALAAELIGDPAGVVRISGPLSDAQVASAREALAPAQTDPANLRKPILNAAGTQSVGPDQQRITIPVDGVLYEVVTPKPGMGQLVPAGR